MSAIVDFHPLRWYVIPVFDRCGGWARIQWLCVQVTVTWPAKPVPVTAGAVAPLLTEIVVPPVARGGFSQ
jgi:hypothetical protein